MPIESAFSAGGVTKTVRGEVQVPIAAGGVEETGSWKPSAASALAALAQADIESLSKPAPKGPPPSEMSSREEPTASGGKGLLDLPPPSDERDRPSQSNGRNGSHAPMLHEAPDRD